MWSLLSVCHSVCLSFCEQDNSPTVVNKCRHNMVGMGKGWPSRRDYGTFWCWQEPDVDLRSLFDFHQMGLSRIYSHCTDRRQSCVSAVVLSETMQQPWRSVSSLSTSCYYYDYILSLPSPSFLLLQNPVTAFFQRLASNLLHSLSVHAQYTHNQQ